MASITSLRRRRRFLLSAAECHSMFYFLAHLVKNKNTIGPEAPFYSAASPTCTKITSLRPQRITTAAPSFNRTNQFRSLFPGHTS